MKKTINTSPRSETPISNIDMPDLEAVFLAKQEHVIKTHASKADDFGSLSVENGKASPEKSEEKNRNEDYHFIELWEDSEDT